MDDLPFNLIDVGIVVVLLVSGALAYARGFVHEVLSVGAWIGAFFIALYGYPYVQPYARQYIPHQLAADVTAGVGLFVVALVVLALLIRAISKTVQESALNALDRSLGFLFGLVRGAFLVCLAYIAVDWMMPRQEQPPWLRGARAMPLVESGADLLWALVPEQAREAGGRAGRDIEDRTRKAIERESEKIIRDAISPKPKSAGGGGEEGYGQKARREMERAIERATEGSSN